MIPILKTAPLGALLLLALAPAHAQGRDNGGFPRDNGGFPRVNGGFPRVNGGFPPGFVAVKAPPPAPPGFIQPVRTSTRTA